MTAIQTPEPQAPDKKGGETQLPHPCQHPARDVVIYDGHCKVCTASVNLLARLGGRSRLAFLSLHDPHTQSVVPELTHDQLMEEMVVVDRRGNRHLGAGAFRYLTRKLPSLWPLAPLLHLPGSLPIWRWCYRRFAAIRYRFGKNRCDEDGCKIHFR